MVKYKKSKPKNDLKSILKENIGALPCLMIVLIGFALLFGLFYLMLNSGA
jgi:hypothetical protein